MIRVVFSNNYRAIQRRIKTLPLKYQQELEANSKTQSKDLIKEFQNGIRRSNLGLKPLAESTVKAKARLPKPSTPLYGKGDTDPKSFINMLRRYKTRNGYRVKPKEGMHHTAKLTFKQLLTIQELGATIEQKRGGKSILIRIPPRPALMLSYERYLKRVRRGEVSKQIKSEITEYLKTGKWKVEKRLARDEYDS